MSTSFQGLLADGSETLKNAGIEEAELDARYLLLEAWGMDTVRFLMNRNNQIPEDKLGKANLLRYQEMIEKRSRRIPLQYVIGSQEFMGLNFKVNEHVLIPRQDTESLVELVLKEHRESEKSILDLCTGSGCIAISLKKLGGYQKVTGSDISKEALKVAAENSGTHGCSIDWIESDLFCKIQPFLYDVIVSNPPYIPTKVIEGLEPEVRDHEPLLALDGTQDGLYFYRRLARQSREYLNPGGYVYYEIGYDQGKEVSGLLKEAGYTHVEVLKDEPGLDRIVRGNC